MRFRTPLISMRFILRPSTIGKRSMKVWVTPTVHSEEIMRLEKENELPKKLLAEKIEAH